MPRYLGPYDHVRLDPNGDKFYRVGDNTPATKDQIELLARSGHRFEGHAAEAGERDVVPPPPEDAPPPESYPHDDRGATLYPKSERQRAAEAPKVADKGA